MILLKNLHYVIQVKRNQKTLFNYLEQTSIQKPLDTHEYSEKSHGRQTKWNVSVFSISSKSKFISQWKECKRLIEVRKTCIKLKTRKKSESIRYYISNIGDQNAQFFNQGIKGHWKIENCLHWVKDVLHQEDKNRVRNKNGAINLSVISSIAFNLQKLKVNKSIKQAIAFCQYNILFSIKLIRT